MPNRYHTRMELRQLRYFKAVAQELHFGRAGEKLGVAQPALSRQVQALEKELGADLFDRAHRRVRLTEAGKAVLSAATRLLADADQLVEEARRAARGETGRLIVAFVGSAMYGPLPTALRVSATGSPAWTWCWMKRKPPFNIASCWRPESMSAC